MDRLTLNNHSIDRILGIFEETDAGSAQRASVALSELMKPVKESIWPEVNYSFSRLTGDGFPLEFTFSSAVNAVSYTTEIAGPEISEAEKIILAGELLSRKSPPGDNNLLEGLINKLASQHNLRYGAWMGGRHGKNMEDRFKTYLEITDESQDLGDTFWQSYPIDSSVFSTVNYKLRMVSLDTQYKMEYYFRFFDMDSWQLLYVINSLGFREQGKELLDFINLISKRRIDKAFIGRNLGFSIALDSKGIPSAISIFTFSYKIFDPGDSSIRANILRCSKYFGWDFGNYNRISEPLKDKTGRFTNHGLIAFSITRDGTKVLQTGLRPPESTNN